VNLKTIGLALVATAFMASSALAQSGTMQPIPNPPEKAKMMKHKKKMHKAMAKSDKAMAKSDSKDAKADMKADAKPAMPAKK
jgi:hypothetical protein